MAAMSPGQAKGYLMTRSLGKFALYAAPVVVAWIFSDVFNWIAAIVGALFPTMIMILDAGLSFRLSSAPVKDVKE